MKKKKFKNQKKKIVIEIKTNSQGWIRVLLLKICKGHVLVKLPSGDIVKRDPYKNIKYDKVKRIPREDSSSPNIYKYLKTKKLKNKYFKKRKKGK